MIRRIIAVCLTIAAVLSGNMEAYACNRTQSDIYVKQILFGDMYPSHSDDEKVEMLLSALYLCSMQSDHQGTDNLNYLKGKKIRRLPSLSEIDVNSNGLLECAHDVWGDITPSYEKVEKKRRRILQSTVNKVFDFGFLNDWFDSDGGQCESFAALLYYSHILTDYLADDPDLTEAVVRGQNVSSYAGVPYVEINGNRPGFDRSEKKRTDSFAEYSQLDSYGRSGVAFANIGPEIMPPSGSRQNIGQIQPSGWPQNQEKYPGLVNSEPPYLYNRCHLIAHELTGNDTKINLITGTRYLNIEGMYPFEKKIAEYVKTTGNHVLYRSTPIYKRKFPLNR